MELARTLVVAAVMTAAGNAAAETEPVTASTEQDDLVARDAPGQVTASPAVASTQREFGAGYFRGTGLGYFGASFAMAWTSSLTPQLHVFGFFDDGSRGFALVPAMKLSFISAARSSPFIAGGVQYMRMWFGDASGGGFGGYGSVGYSFRFEPGFELEIAVGLNGKQSIRGSDGMVSVTQSASFGPHWDAGLRYWF